MRRMILTSLVLLPVMAHAQARPSAEFKPSTFAELALPATPAATAVSSTHTMTSTEASDAVQELIRIRTVDDSAAVETFDPIPRSQASTPSVKSAAAFGLLPQELEHQPAVIAVVVDAMVDANGIPHNISISHSAGKLIDQKAVAAVSQYRFQPALLDNRPTPSNVSITIKIQQP
jgi:TonB family protein